MNILSKYSLKKQNKDLLKILETAFPDNNIVQESLQSLISRKATWIQRLQILWEKRKQPVLNVFQVREICLQYQQKMNENKVLISCTGEQTPYLPNALEFFVKSQTSWKGFSPHARRYHEQPILFGDNIRSDEFRSRIISDSQSGAVIIIQSVQNLIIFGEERGVGKQQFSEIFLSFIQDFLPQSFSSFSRFANDCDKLFHELISLIDLDQEIDKFKLSLCKISRSANEAINLPCLKIKRSKEIF